MAKKKHHKKHPNRPSVTLKREARLVKARQWLPTYQGTKIVRAYRQRFCVDVANAVRDLRELGYEFQPGYVDNLLKSEELRQAQQRAKKEERRESEYGPDQDDNFFYIAGYTSGGAAYGVTWDEMARNMAHDRRLNERKQIKPTPVLFSELDEKQKKEALARLDEMIGDYFLGADYLPTDEDRDEILDELCDELTENFDEWTIEPGDTAELFGWDDEWDEDDFLDDDDDGGDGDYDGDDADSNHNNGQPKIVPFKTIIPDNELKAEFNSIVNSFVEELKADGIEIPTFLDSLIVAETERMRIRQFYDKDLGPLIAIMKKPEVMYVWEAGFNKGETRKWLNRQYTRYHKDGYGYFAVTLKDTGKLIGQAGLIKTEVNGENGVEIGYIFDNTFWGHGYAIEAIRACVDLAFNEIGLDKLYATIRPENAASVKVAEKLGMRKIGQYVKTYQGKKMPHDIYILENKKEERAMQEAMQEVLDFLKKANTYYLATVEGDQPRNRPFGTINLFEGKLYIQTGKKKDVAKQIAANPKVEICAFDNGTWLRVACTLVEDNRAEAQESLLAAYPSLSGMYAVNDGNNVVHYLKDATATFSTFGGEPKVVTF